MCRSYIDDLEMTVTAIVAACGLLCFSGGLVEAVR
jgi:hypothetical protein